MRRVVLVTVIIAVVVGVAGCAAAYRCGRARRTRRRSARRTGQASQTTPPPSDRAVIYTAMIRRYLTSGESSYPGSSRWRTSSTRPRPTRLDPAERQAPHEAIPSADQFAIENGLRDLGEDRVRHQPGRGGRHRRNGCAQVRDGGILITLAPVTSAKGAGTDRVEVGISGFVACLGATWFTYVVEGATASGPDRDHGPVAIA